VFWKEDLPTGWFTSYEALIRSKNADTTCIVVIKTYL